MYLISAYFDNDMNKTLSSYINGASHASGNIFMTEHNVPPHLTLSAFESRNVDAIIPLMKGLGQSLSVTDIRLVSYGALSSYVIYASPVFDERLRNMSIIINDMLEKTDCATVQKYYLADNFFPHVTIAKTLDEYQMQQVFSYMQKHFHVIKGKITELGLAKTNPHEDIIRVRLE